MIDAHNYDDLKSFREEGGTFDAEQEAIWAELQTKMKSNQDLAAELAKPA